MYSLILDDQSPEIKMALRKAWQKMKRTLPLQNRQHLVTRELWEIFLSIYGIIQGSNDEGNLNSFSNSN